MVLYLQGTLSPWSLSPRKYIPYCYIFLILYLPGCLSPRKFFLSSSYFISLIFYPFVVLCCHDPSSRSSDLHYILTFTDRVLNNNLPKCLHGSSLFKCFSNPHRRRGFNGPSLLSRMSDSSVVNVRSPYERLSLPQKKPGSKPGKFQHVSA